MSVVTLQGGGAGVTDHGLLDAASLLDDDHSQYFLLAGRSGGQTGIGGTGASEELTLRGTSNANLGQIRCQSPITFDDTYPAAALNQYFVSATPAQTITGALIGGVYNGSPVITFTNGFFIWEALRGSPNIVSGVDPGFAAFTLFQGLPLIRAGSAFNPLNVITLNAGTIHQNEFVASRSCTYISLNHGHQLKTTVNGAVLSASSIGLQYKPSYSTVAGSTVNFTSCIAVNCMDITNGLFQPAAGVENLTEYIGLDFDNIVFGGNVTKAAVRSAQAAATNAYFLLQTGFAQSVLLGQLKFQNDLSGVTFGASDDFQVGWGALDFWFWQFNASTDQLRWSNPSSLRFLLSGATPSTIELNLDCAKFSLGAQTGAIGNQVGAFVTPTRSTAVNGGWADFLLTHGGNLTLNNTMTEISAWAINPVSLSSGTGSLNGPISCLRVGGMTTSLVGANETMGLFAGGRTKLQGCVQYPPINPSNMTGTITQWSGLLTGSQNNNMRRWARITCDAATTLEGIDSTAVQDGDTYEITNVGSNALAITNQAPGALAADRIILGAWGGTLGIDETITIRYDLTTARWRVLDL